MCIRDRIQVFGQTKIIADQRSNSLLVFATQADMVRIKEVVAKLDVLLAQVLIESVIVEVTLGHTFSLGVSAAQNPKTLSPSAVSYTHLRCRDDECCAVRRADAGAIRARAEN